MKIGDLATIGVISVPADTQIDTAIAIMEEHEIHHLPVLSADGKLAGMLSDRDILTAVGWLESEKRCLPGGRLAGPRRVGEIMAKAMHILSPGDSLRLATRLMIRERIHALPLVQNHRLTGIVAESDILRGILAMPELTDTKRPLFARPITSLITGELKTVNPRTTFDELVDRMCRDKIRHLPVVAVNELLGIISDRDVRRAIGRDMIRDEVAQEAGTLYLGSPMAMEIMRTDVKTIDASATVGQGVDELLSNRIHSLPVIQQGKLLGIVTDTDMLRAIGNEDHIS